MDMHVLPWIKDDVAIEIIGKMIAEQMEGVYKLIEEYKQAGYRHDSQEILADVRYQELLQRIGDFKQEIDQIYNGNDLDNLYKKVDKEYVPYLNKQYTQVGKQTDTERDFNETKGAIYIYEEGMTRVISSNGSSVPNPLNGLKLKVVKSKTQAFRVY